MKSQASFGANLMPTRKVSLFDIVKSMEEEQVVDTAEPRKVSAKASKWKRFWKSTRFGEKTGWEWLELLIVPAVLLVEGFWLSASQEERAMQAESRRAAAEADQALQRTQDEALQAYLDQIGELMLNRNLLEAGEEDAVLTLGRARTATVMTRLNDEENISIVRFLTDAGLTGAGDSSVSVLREIDLPKTDLQNVYFSEADLTGANLVGINARGAVFDFANLKESVLTDADLTYATMIETNLYGIILQEATLKQAILKDANLSGVRLNGTNLSQADLRGLNLSGAYLSSVGDQLEGANLGGANLTGADLSGADLIDANLTNANLANANLTDVASISNEQLRQQAESLKGATLPEG